MRLSRCLLLLPIQFALACPLSAGDWPQILGPNRNGVAVQEAPIAAWPKEGPKKLWSTLLGLGFAGPAVVGNRVIVYHRIQNKERLECFDAATGTSQWLTEFDASYAGGVNPDNGPRCVPLIHQDRVYVFGAAGVLHCVALADGKNVWSRDAYSDYKGQEGYFGAGSTPIVAAGKLLVNVGGRNAGIVAFNLADGKTAWTAVDDRASYSSPTNATIAGRPYVIFVTRLQCVAVDPSTGETLFAVPFGKTGPTVNAATPLVLNDSVFVSASYGIGAQLLRLGKSPEVIWRNDESMSSQYSTCVFHQGKLYGIHGREDQGIGELRCLDATTGKVRWNMANFGVGHLMLVGSQLLILTADGRLVLAEANPDKYNEVARATVSTAVTRSLPAFSNGRFYFRESEAGSRLVCLQLK